MTELTFLARCAAGILGFFAGKALRFFLAELWRAHHGD